MPVIVLFTIVAVVIAPVTRTPSPPLCPELLEIVQFAIIVEPPPIINPPDTVFPETVLSVMVNVPWLKMPAAEPPIVVF